MASNVNEAAVAAIQGQGVTPPTLGTKADMAPLTAAGIDLARRTMVMIGVAFTTLLILLLWADVSQRAEISKTNERLYSLFETDQRSSLESRLAATVALLEHSAADPAWSVPETSEAKQLIDDALKMASLTADQRASLDGKCLPLPASVTPGRAAILIQCAQTLKKIFGRGEGFGLKVETIQAQQKFLAEERAAYRTFWIQVAQLILINLLLPILTALLGYIFGTQQGQKTT